MSLGAIRTAEASPEECNLCGVKVSESPAHSQAIADYFVWKGFIDRPLAAGLLIVFSPVIAILWLVVKCSSKGAGFYGQRRVGNCGAVFTMYKLRTMRADAEAGTGAIWSAVNDPRVTRIGQVLRKLHLDELPQLYNVVKGEMSLVGPRPERPEYVRVLAGKIDKYNDRHLVRPGITGLAQLNLPPDTDLNSVARKVVLDLEYIRDATLWLETRLLLCTFTRIFKLPTIGPLGLHRTVNLPEPEVRMAMTPTMIDIAADRDTKLADSASGHDAENSQGPLHHRAKSRAKTHASARSI